MEFTPFELVLGHGVRGPLKLFKKQLLHLSQVHPRCSVFLGFKIICGMLVRLPGIIFTKLRNM